MNQPDVAKRESGFFYYGWLVLAASAVAEMLVAGATAYGAGLFVLPLQAEFGLSRTSASSALTILFVGSVLVAPYAGRAVDRYPIRWVMSAGALIFSASLALIALSHSLLVMALLLLIPAPLGFAVLGPMTTATLASRWFFRRRGLALGIAAIATSGGGLVVVPFLSKAIQTYGWRPAMLGEAAVLFVLIVSLALLVLKDNPFRAGLGAHRENQGRDDGVLLLNPAGNRIAAWRQWREILLNSGFWMPSVLVATVSAICQVIVVSVPAYGHQLGFTPGGVALLISAFSIAAALTKILVGVMADYWNNRILLFAAAILIPLTLALLRYSSGYDAILTACGLAGVALGGVLPTSAAVLAARFGTLRMGSVMGWTYVLIYGLIIALVLFTGSVFDKTGSYRPAFTDLLIFSLLVWIAALAADSRRAR